MFALSLIKICRPASFSLRRGIEGEAGANLRKIIFFRAYKKELQICMFAD